jgi:hypothetical protein
MEYKKPVHKLSNDRKPREAYGIERDLSVSCGFCQIDEWAGDAPFMSYGRGDAVLAVVRVPNGSHDRANYVCMGHLGPGTVEVYDPVESRTMSRAEYEGLTVEGTQPWWRNSAG